MVSGTVARHGDIATARAPAARAGDCWVGRCAFVDTIPKSYQKSHVKWQYSFSSHGYAVFKPRPGVFQCVGLSLNGWLAVIILLILFWPLAWGEFTCFTLVVAIGMVCTYGLHFCLTSMVSFVTLFLQCRAC